MVVNLLNKNAYSAVNLFNKVQLISPEEITKMGKGVFWIHNILPKAILIGGTAVVNYLHSGRDLTPDLDYLYHDFESLSTILDTNNIAYNDLHNFNDQVIGITIPSLNIDILNKKSVHSILYQFILKDYSTTIIGNIPCNVIAVELLIIQKIMLGRNKDIDDAIALIQGNNLNQAKLTVYLNKLHADSVDIDSILNFITAFKTNLSKS
jgi:hypothetical protein